MKKKIASKNRLKKSVLGTLALALIVTSSMPAQAVEYSAHGYYRLRFEYTHDLDLQRPNAGVVPGDPDNDSNDRFGSIAYGQQRFRLDPIIKLNDHLSIHGSLDFLDNLLFGQSEVASLNIANPIVGNIALPEANGPFGVVGPQAGDAAIGSGGGSLNVRRIYVDILTSAGKFRIGRQPSHFGLGIFNNDGNDMEGDFGDTFDRVLYLAGLDLKNGDRLNFGLAFDYAYEATRDPSIGGLDTAVASNGNDMMQGGLLLLYQNENFEFGTFSGLRFRDGNDGQTTTTATYVYDSATDGVGRVDPTTGIPLTDGVSGIRKPAGIDGNTLLYIIDLYGKFKFMRDYSFGFEGVYVGGKMATGVAVDSVILDDAAQAGLPNPLPAPITLPQSGNSNDVSVIMAATELDAKWGFGGEAHVQAGFASGDSSPLSSRITQLGFRPDYDIALMMFDVPLGTSPAIRVGGITEQGRKPMSPNYINNAIYFTGEYKHEFDVTSGIPWAKDFKVGGKFITAFAPSRNLDIDFEEVTGTAGLPRVVNASKWYGVEIDASVEATFFEFLHWKTVAGVFLPGGLYDIKNDDSANLTNGIINPILFDGANPSIAAKTTLFFEF